jgi:hypothetical protein
MGTPTEGNQGNQGNQQTYGSQGIFGRGIFQEYSMLKRSVSGISHQQMERSRTSLF